jgi:hypothetical protein
LIDENENQIMSRFAILAMIACAQMIEITGGPYMPPFPTQGRTRLEISSDGGRLRGSTGNFKPA